MEEYTGYTGEQMAEDIWTALRKAMMDGPAGHHDLPMWIELSAEQHKAMMEIFVSPMFEMSVRALLQIALGMFKFVDVADPKMN